MVNQWSMWFSSTAGTGLIKLLKALFQPAKQKIPVTLPINLTMVLAAHRIICTVLEPSSFSKSSSPVHHSASFASLSLSLSLSPSGPFGVYSVVAICEPKIASAISTRWVAIQAEKCSDQNAEQWIL